MGDQNIIVELTAKTDQFEQGLRKIDLATVKTIKGVTYFFAEASAKALTFADSLERVTRGMLKLQTVGKNVGDVLFNALGKLAEDVIEPITIKLDDSATAFQKFVANIVNGITELVAKVVTQGLLYAAFISLLNLIPPPGVIGTGFAKFLAGGMAWKDIFGGGKPGIPVEGSKQAGGEVEKTGLHRLHKGEWVIPSTLARVLGRIAGLSPQGITPHSLEERFDALASRLTGGFQRALQPARGLQSPPIHIHISGGLDTFIEGIERIDDTPDNQKRFGRVVRKAIGKDREAD